MDVDNGRYGTLPQRGGRPNGSRDVSPLMDADYGRQGTLPQQGDQPHGLHDVSLPAEADKDRQRTLPQHGGLLNGSHDVSPQVDVDNGRQGAFPHYVGQPDGSCAVSPPTNRDNGCQGTLPQNFKVLATIIFNNYDVLDDAPQEAKADIDRQGLLPQHGGHPNGTHDDSPPPAVDNGHQGTLSQRGGERLHGANGRGQEEKKKSRNYATLRMCTKPQVKPVNVL